MATFDYVVDTGPMASSVNTVSEHVGMTTAAVVAMQTAVIEAENESAEHICNNIDRGFFSLIRSQVSTKLAQRFSELNAKFISLAQMSKSLCDKKDRMESDVSRLRREYYKTFRSLDKALEHRIVELDGEAYRLAQERKTLITGSFLRSVPDVVCFGNETQTASQLAYTARLKNKTSRAIGNIGKNLNETAIYKNEISEIMYDDIATNVPKEYIPVLLVSEKSMVSEDTKIFKLVAPETLSKQAASTIESEFANLSVEDNDSPIEEYDRDQIRKEFQTYVDNSELSPRVTESIMNLFIEGGH